MQCIPAKSKHLEILHFQFLMSVVYLCSGRPKRLFIFVNPYGGKKSAKEIFVNDVKPLLDDANVEYTVQGCAREKHLL